MATVNITFFHAHMLYDNSSTIIDVQNSSGQDITSSSSSQTSTAASEDSVCRIACSSDGDVYVKFGTAPTASNGQTFRILAGTVEYFFIPSGYKVAVVDPS